MQVLVKYFVFLIIAFVVLSIFQFPSPILVGARKITSNNNVVFSVELIRRNSSVTALRDIGRGRTSFVSTFNGHNIAPSSELYDTSNVQTEIISDHGYYAMKFSVGTPPVEFTAVPDTGSDLIWVQCSPCQRCLAQNTPFFDPTKSSTDNKIACTDQVCNNDQLGLLGTGCTRNNICAYLAGYGDGTNSSGVLSKETITFTSPTTSFSNIMFGCGYYQEGDLGPDADGIVGLGGGPLSLVSQLGPNINYKFSYCLTSPASKVNAKLNFGLDVTGPGVVSTPYTKQDSPPTFYYLTLDSISIGDTSVPVAQNIYIDSGTTLTNLPSNVYNGVKTALQASIGLNPMADPTQTLDLCYEAQSLGGNGPSPPNVVFNFKGANVVLKPENTFITIEDLTCLAMLPSNDNFVFGNVAQVNFHIGYDLQANRVSFAPQDCSTF
ncbi:hypothetical protein RND81_11G023600 [Saponaria officinalis]|uniref:Peptidase A1 domain-containing protein n=1 Tax=Saponaria officinalis TaxID=3572 RepID=A0AAW1HHW6_SAPOF